MSTSIFRYLYLTNFSVVENLDEKNNIRFFRNLVILSSLIFTFLEFSFLTNHKNLFLFVILSHEENPKMQKPLLFLFIIIAIIYVMLLIQRRINISDTKNWDYIFNPTKLKIVLTLLTVCFVLTTFVPFLFSNVVVSEYIAFTIWWYYQCFFLLGYILLNNQKRIYFLKKLRQLV